MNEFEGGPCFVSIGHIRELGLINIIALLCPEHSCIFFSRHEVFYMFVVEEADDNICWSFLQNRDYIVYIEPS